MLEEIGRARDHVYIEVFIFKGDELGRRFARALAQKARKGVRVCVVYDALASLTTPADLFPEGVEVLPYRPFSVLRPTSFLNPYNYVRDHRKILSVDDRVAFLGGFNFGAIYEEGWRDTHMRVTGDVVHDIEDAFAESWNRHRGEGMAALPLSRQERAWNPATILRINDPTLGLFPIRSMFLGPFNRAKRRIYLTSVYFVPSRTIQTDLIDAAQRGVDVRVLVPRQTSYPLADWLARRHFGSLLRAGVRIFEYDEHYVNHSKTATVDGVWSTVGSANIDSLSLFGLHEVNLELYSERFAKQMEEVFEMDEGNSEELTLEKWENRPLLNKLVEAALAPIRPFG
jgi:cardiolipin synthase